MRNAMVGFLMLVTVCVPGASAGPDPVPGGGSLEDALNCLAYVQESLPDVHGCPDLPLSVVCIWGEEWQAVNTATVDVVENVKQRIVKVPVKVTANEAIMGLPLGVQVNGDCQAQGDIAADSSCTSWLWTPGSKVDSACIVSWYTSNP